MWEVGVGLVFYVRLTPIILLYCYCFYPAYICPSSLFWGMMKTMSWHWPPQSSLGKIFQPDVLLSSLHQEVTCQFSLYNDNVGPGFPFCTSQLEEKDGIFLGFLHFFSTKFIIEWHEYWANNTKIWIFIYSSWTPQFAPSRKSLIFGFRQIILIQAPSVEVSQTGSEVDYEI